MATEEGIEVPPILGSDLILYPYQLYKLYLAGSDAVVLVAGALSSKDLLYLTKIAASLKLQVVISVTSTVQIDSLMKLEKGSIHAVIVSNRELEDFSFDMSGQQALSLLTSASMKALLEHHGADLPVLVEGRVGLIGRDGYVDELKSAGAIGAVCGGALADKELSEQLLNS
jgi:indole-3-glycerol phosphate synthase